MPVFSYNSHLQHYQCLYCIFDQYDAILNGQKMCFSLKNKDISKLPHTFERKCIYSALRKYSAPLNFATFCHISGFKHKDIKLYFFVKNQQEVGHNHEVERHLLDISNFFNKSKTEKLGVQNYSAPLS